MSAASVSLVLAAVRRFGFERAKRIVFEYASAAGLSRGEISLLLARQAFDDGLLSDAFYWFKRCYCNEPGRADVIHQFGLSSPKDDAGGGITLRLALFARAVLVFPGDDRIKSDWLYERYLSGDAKAARELVSLAEISSDIFALTGAAIVARELQMPEFAERLASKAVVLYPGTYLSFSKRAVVAFAAGETGSAESDLRRSMTLNPSALEPLINFGRILELRGDLRAALKIYTDVLSHRPDLAEPRLNAAILHLGFGDFDIGWRWYDSRWRAKSIVTAGRDKVSARLRTTKPPFTKPRRGRVLVWAEQGLGDEIMFASMLSELADDADRVIVQADVRLIPLMKRSFPNIDFQKRVRPVDQHLYDSHLPLGDLGAIYRPNLKSFESARHPYLFADNSLTECFRERLKPNLKTVGISWSTENPDNGRFRAVALRQLCEVMAATPIQIVNLQYKYDPSELESVARSIGVQIHCFNDVDNFNTIDRLASLIKACDLVISIGNTTAHLSAALGVTTWVLTPVSGSWRWMFDGDRTPWYPCVRVFRQSTVGDWTSVLISIKAELSRL